MDKLNRCIEDDDDDSLEKYNTIWDKVRADMILQFFDTILKMYFFEEAILKMHYLKDQF